MLLRSGDVIDFASCWLTGGEDQTRRDDIARSLIEAKPAIEQQFEVRFGPATIHELAANESPWPVPNHIQGQTPTLLVARATVKARRPQKRSLFLTELEPADLALLRRITRRVRKRIYPNEGPLTDRQCDTVINDLGPDAALETLRGLRRSDLN
jgi:hypothetical protein